jgi:hypothetical protein
MIPAINVPDLMLRHDVVEAVSKKRFHIYAVERSTRASKCFPANRRKWMPPRGYQAEPYTVSTRACHISRPAARRRGRHTEVAEAHQGGREADQREKDIPPQPPKKRRRTGKGARRK